MIVGIRAQYNFGRWNLGVFKFTDQKTADLWLAVQEYGGCIKTLNDNEESALAEIQGYGWNKQEAQQVLEFADTGTFNEEKGYIDYKFSQAFINRQMGWE